MVIWHYCAGKKRLIKNGWMGVTMEKKYNNNFDFRDEIIIWIIKNDIIE